MSGGDMMPREQYDFIKDIHDYMLEASNMTENEAWDFGFRVWQFRDFLKDALQRKESE